ncbi:MAG: TIGR02147 family protein [Oligoflexus sp.]
MSDSDKSRDTKLSIYGYTDYSKYLLDYYEQRKTSHRGYSYRIFSRDAGFSSPNILKLVIDGQRKIGPASVDKFIQGLGLSGPMAEYFRVLVQLKDAKHVEDKKRLLQVLTRLTPHQKRRFLNPESIEFLSHWLYPVLREMVELRSFSDDPHWIARRLVGRTTVAEISKALNFLKKHGFVRKGGDGLYHVQDAMVLSSDEVKSLAVRQFHQVILQQSKEMLEDLDMQDREYGSLIIKLPDHALDELKQKLKSFRSELHRWALEQEDLERSQVVQVNFQMYPQMRRAKA